LLSQAFILKEFHSAQITGTFFSYKNAKYQPYSFYKKKERESSTFW
jgi:hypothetical protein